MLFGMSALKLKHSYVNVVKFDIYFRKILRRRKMGKIFDKMLCSFSHTILILFFGHIIDTLFACNLSSLLRTFLADLLPFFSP